MELVRQYLITYSRRISSHHVTDEEIEETINNYLGTRKTEREEKMKEYLEYKEQKDNAYLREKKEVDKVTKFWNKILLFLSIATIFINLITIMIGFISDIKFGFPIGVLPLPFLIISVVKLSRELSKSLKLREKYGY